MRLFKDISNNPNPFWKILPEDWRIEIEPVWDKYARCSSVFGLLNDQELEAGLISFSTVSPDTMCYREYAESWFKRGYRYIGFVYVVESMRGQGLGREILEKLLQSTPKTAYWLSIEDHKLRTFYEKLSFKLVDKIPCGDSTDWIMSRD